MESDQINNIFFLHEIVQLPEFLQLSAIVFFKGHFY